MISDQEIIEGFMLDELDKIHYALHGVTPKQVESLLREELTRLRLIEQQLAEAKAEIGRLRMIEKAAEKLIGFDGSDLTIGAILAFANLKAALICQDRGLPQGEGN